MQFAFGKALDFDGGQYGVGILSKYKIDKSQVVNLPSGNAEQRIVLLSQITKKARVRLTMHFSDFSQRSNMMSIDAHHNLGYKTKILNQARRGKTFPRSCRYSICSREAFS